MPTRCRVSLARPPQHVLPERRRQSKPARVERVEDGADRLNQSLALRLEQNARRSDDGHPKPLGGLATKLLVDDQGWRPSFDGERDGLCFSLVQSVFQEASKGLLPHLGNLYPRSETAARFDLTSDGAGHDD